MSGVALKTVAEKIINRGGGVPTRTVVSKEKDALGKEHSWHQHQIASRSIPGSDYVVFNCPGCGKRNRACVHNIKGKVGDDLVFKCNGCLREIVVARPIDLSIGVVQPSSIPSGLVNQFGTPVSA